VRAGLDLRSRRHYIFCSTPYDLGDVHFLYVRSVVSSVIRSRKIVAKAHATAGGNIRRLKPCPIS